MPPWRAALVGGLSVPTLGALVAAATAEYWPNGPVLGVLGRMLDSLTPHLAVCAGLGAVLLFLLGARKWGGALLLATVAVAGQGLWHHVQLSQATRTDLKPDLKVLWFNMLSTNRTLPAQLAQALIDAPADVILVSEAAPLRSQRQALDLAFPLRVGCDRSLCDMMVLARQPLVFVEPLRKLAPHETRVIRLGWAAPEGDPTRPAITLLAAHMVKPWYHGPAQDSHWALSSAIVGSMTPLVVIGDFNAAPWAQSARILIADHGLSPMRVPVATWPVQAGRLGVPIDQVLVSSGVAVTSVSLWGQGLGSNHLGLLVGLARTPS